MYRKARSKEERENLELVRLNRDLRLLVQQYLFQLGQIDRQLSSQMELIQYSENLLKLEQIRFEAGESNLFIVNTRERRLLENQLGLLDLEKMFLGNWIYLQYVTGLPLQTMGSELN
jgi:outer membrane protein TolC